MQRIFNSLLGFSLVIMVVFSTGCGEDEPGGGGGTNPLGPTIFLASGTDLVSTDASVPFVGGSFNVQIDLSDGDNPLNTLTITENGTTIPAANLTFDGGATTAQNPFLILGADQSGTVYEVTITPSGLTANETRFYEFTVADSEGLTNVFSVNVTFAASAPTIEVTLQGTNGVLSIGNPTFEFTLASTETDFPIAQVAFYEDGVLLPADSVILVGGDNDPISANPENIMATDNIYVENFRINAPNPSPSVRTYRVDVIDSQGVAGSTSFTISFLNVDIIPGVLLNAGGPPGTGGLDLDEGIGTGSQDATAEIKDEGIDLGAPSNAENWIQRISAVNNAELRSLNDGNAPDNFDFDLVTDYSQVTAAYSVGAPVTISDVVETGDIYAVERDGNFYLIRVDNITVTEDDNGDNYELTIINESN